MPRCKYFKFKVIENHCKQKGEKNAKKEIATNLFSAQIILKHTLETHPNDEKSTGLRQTPGRKLLFKLSAEFFGVLRNKGGTAEV